MAGICGLLCKTLSPNLATLHGEMASRLKHHSWYVTHQHVDVAGGVALGRVGLGFVNTAPQPAYNKDQSLLAVMDGEVYDYAEQRRALTALGREFQSDSHAELLLHGYESKGKLFFRGLQGSFAAAIYDTRNRRLTLINDRFGMRPLYYAKLPDRLLFAGEIKALLADPAVNRRRNLRGIAQFFTFGQLLGEDTLLETVRILPAAGWVTYDGMVDQLAVERYWELEARPAEAVREAEVLDRLDEAFKRAVDRRVTGTTHLGLSLSGGLDARTILAVIDHERVPVTTVTLGIEGSLDHRTSQQMAALTNRRHHTFTLDGRFLAEFEKHMRRLVYLTDGHFLSQCITLPTLPLYRELGIEVLLRGHAGELLHMDKAYSFSLDSEALALRDEAGLENWLFRHLRAFVAADGSGSLFAAPLEGEIEGLARDSLRACLREASGLEPPLHRIWHLFLMQRLRRETALSLVEFGSVVETRLPYLDTDLVDLLLSIPPQMKIGDKIQAHILRRRRPEFLNVVNANTGARLGAGPLAVFLAKARLKVLSKLGVRGYQPYERLGRWLREELRPLVEHLLLNDLCFERGIFDPQTVRKIVEHHWSGAQNHTFLLMAMMLFELGQRELLDEGASYRAVEADEKALV
jgi:asparagine synthase (glutamine-hydrolysing)